MRSSSARPDGAPLVEVVGVAGERRSAPGMRRQTCAISMVLALLRRHCSAAHRPAARPARVRARSARDVLRLTAAAGAARHRRRRRASGARLRCSVAGAAGERARSCCSAGRRRRRRRPARDAGVQLRARLARDARRRPRPAWLRFIAAPAAGRQLSSRPCCWCFERVLRTGVDPATVDLRHFSLHPWSATRLALLGGILIGPAAALWAGTLVLSVSPRALAAAAAAGPSRARPRLLWIAPSVAVARRGALRRLVRAAARACWRRRRLRGRGAGRPRASLVPARHRRLADPRAVHRVSAAGAAGLSVGRLLRGRARCGG